jgi:ParB-like chromosome segregation protein Spo0J
LEDISLGLLLEHPENSNFMGTELLKKLRRHIEGTGSYEPLIVRPHPRVSGRFEIINGHNRLRVLRALNYQTVRCLVWDADDDQTRLYMATLNRLCGSEVPERRAVLVGELLANFEADRLADLLPEGRKRIQALERLYRLDLEESARQASPEENLEVPVINAFMLDESHAKELDLALDLIVNTEKRRLSRGQALARLARFYIQSHKPARRERACRLKQVGK